MANIRELFHSIGNWHNKITLGAGVARMEIKQQFKDVPLTPEAERMSNKLKELEQQAVEASRVLHELKDIVYGILDPDTDKPREK